MKAVWGTDYDYYTDEIYKRPSCPECGNAIRLDNEGKYHCFMCDSIVSVEDPKMVEWFKVMNETKTEVCQCFQCGSKNSYIMNYCKNPVTLEWQLAYGGCKNCGIRFIV